MSSEALNIDDFNEPESEYLEKLSNQELAKYLVKHALPEEMLECLKSQNDIYNTDAGKRQIMELEKFVTKQKPADEEEMETEEEFELPKIQNLNISGGQGKSGIEEQMEKLSLSPKRRRSARRTKKRRSVRRNVRRKTRRRATRRKRRSVRKVRRAKRRSKPKIAEGSMEDVFGAIDTMSNDKIKGMKGRELKTEINKILKAKGVKKTFKLADIKSHLKRKMGFGKNVYSKGDMVVRSRDIYGLQPVRYDTKNFWDYPNTNFVKRKYQFH